MLASRSGNSRCSTLIPTPTTALVRRPLLTWLSTRMPASFCRSTSTSLGHLTLTLANARVATASRTARPAHRARPGVSSGLKSGRSTSENHKPAPGGDNHSLPRRPRPRAWLSAPNKAPWAAPALAASIASSLVDSVSSRQTSGRPKPSPRRSRSASKRARSKPLIRHARCPGQYRRRAPNG
jgi:hypothetical protein